MSFAALLLLTALGALGPEDPVTVMGEKVLPESDLVVRGAAAETSRVGAGTGVTSFEVTEVLLGRERDRRLLVLSSDPEFFGAPGFPVVVFLKRLGEGRYRGVTRVLLTGSEAERKLEALRDYLRIEAIADGAEKRRALHDLLMKHVSSPDSRFLLYSAARELAHFTEKNADLFSPDDLNPIRGRVLGTTDPVLKGLLETVLANLGAKTRGPLTDEDGEPVRVDRHGLPAPREFRRMSADWRKGDLEAAERLAVVRAVTARHIKFALPILLDALDDEDARVREAAAMGFAEGLFDEGREPLRKRLAVERVPEVRKAVVRSLGFLRAEDALPAILELAKDPDLLKTAIFAAARIGGPLAADWLATIRTTYGGEDDEARAIRRLLEFLESDAFRKQEEALLKIRKERLR